MTADADSTTRTRQSLIDGMKRGEAARWEAFVRQYLPRIRGWMSHLPLGDADLDDVGQEVAAAVFQHIGRYAPRHERGSFRAWLKQIVRSKAMDRLRRGGRESAADDPALEAQCDKAAGVADELIAGELAAQLDALVKADTPPKEWEAWQGYLEGEQREAIAERLGVTPGSVTIYLSNVRRRMRQAADALGLRSPDAD